MSTSDEPEVDSATELTGVLRNRAAEVGGGRPEPQANRPSAGRIPASVTAMVTQWSTLGFDQQELARLCYDELSVRLAAGWPEWASQLGQISLDDIVDELTRARQVLAERAGRHRSDDEHGAAEQADADWLQRWAERLERANWMPIGDQSAHAVADAIERALHDCDQARQLAPNAGAVVVQQGILKIIT